METMDKVIRIGTLSHVGSVYVRIEYDGKRLSVTGVEGPLRSGNGGSAGQIISGFKEYDGRGYKSIADIDPAPAWSSETIRQLFDVWERWHLNDMRAGCEHQRAMGWDKLPIDSSKPTTDYGKHFEGQQSDSWNLLGWIRQDEYPEGLLMRPCPECGYRYGSAWLHEEVPEDVLQWLSNLPDTDHTPAWV